MQQLNFEKLNIQAHREQEAIRLEMALPGSPLATERFIKRLANTLDLTSHSHEWGADRFQAVLEAGDIRCLLCIEWLCDAVWLENAGGEFTNIEQLWQLLQLKCQPRGS
ncbi:DUF3630 family protein [Alteromonas pelagimontana]|uniref:DUF3630 family protein n=1 Tax=Alteromonas pelagimontana TaxID=1858656 RepID=A0A6M4MDJ7_9ALTE|nr:DUF3630 family protein [Alteromonas pelagimontana]QJR81193.1 DUF3630 family protein [Alteromonas pelagimontana]